jgi:hypothetical protein
MDRRKAMNTPVTVLECAEHILGREPQNGGDFEKAGLPIMGGCEVCGASIAAFNACPSKTGFLRCKNGCIADQGYTSAEEFVKATDKDFKESEILSGYLECAVWSSTREDGRSLDEEFATDDFSENAFRQAMQDTEGFVQLAGDLLDGLDLEEVGHDFWLTRNRHGAGFWDGDYEGETGKKLTEIAHSFGECTVYVGDNGELELT